MTLATVQEKVQEAYCIMKYHYLSTLKIRFSYRRPDRAACLAIL
jgi:hypothetical protein